MSGLLGLLGQSTGNANKDAAINQGLLQMGLQMLQGKGNFGQVLGQGGMAGINGYNQSMDQSWQEKQRAEQEKQWEEQKRRQERERLKEELAKKYFLTPEQASLQNGKGPTLENAAKIGEPSYDFNGYANALAQYDPVQAMQLRAQLAKPTRKLTSVAPGASLVDEATGQPVYSAPAKDDAPSAIREYQFAVGQGYKGSFADWDKERRRAGASSVSVNTGQKGFDNTLKLRGDFRSEPVYKAHQEMQSAYSQIQQSLKQNSPAGDLAGATKIMKLLDPGSVVRESELGMAMQASGLLDRVENYATNIIKGTKLTPTQRADFQKLADALYGESVKQYNAKRGEYQGIAQRNDLNVMDVLGDPSAAPKANIVNFGDLK